jgi:hypothetical protein
VDTLLPGLAWTARSLPRQFYTLFLDSTALGSNLTIIFTTFR